MLSSTIRFGAAIRVLIAPALWISTGGGGLGPPEPHRAKSRDSGGRGARGGNRLFQPRERAGGGRQSCRDSELRDGRHDGVRGSLAEAADRCVPHHLPDLAEPRKLVFER